MAALVYEKKCQHKKIGKNHKNKEKKSKKKKKKFRHSRKG